jgi:hypothetical protein
MRRSPVSRLSMPALLLAATVALSGCADATGPDPALDAAGAGIVLVADAPSLSTSPEACWGQATKVFAQLGEMGTHSSQQPNPRVGLANLARLLYMDGVIDEPTMQALGAFVADALGLSIEACMD